MALLAETTRMATVRATTPYRLLALARDSFHALFRSQIERLVVVRAQRIAAIQEGR